MKLGTHIRKIRKEKRVTLVELSQITGIAQATLSRIETGVMRGTVDCHRKVAEALGLDISELYSGIDPKKEEITYRSKENISQAAIIKNKNVRLEILTTQLAKKKFAPILVTLPGSEELRFDKIDRNTDKFLWIQKGKIKLSLSGEEFELQENDTIYFDGSFPHKLANMNPTESVLLSVTSPPNL